MNEPDDNFQAAAKRYLVRAGMPMYTLPLYAATRAQERVKSVNARAEKRGLTGRLRLEVSEPYTVRQTDEYGFSYTETVVDVTLSGVAPQFGDWTLIAAVDTVETETGQEMIIRSLPGASPVDRDALAPGRCDHCQTDRFRRYTYAVEHADGTVLQVGKTCLKDFLGHNVSLITPTMMEDVENALARPVDYPSVTRVIAIALAAVASRGVFVGSRAAYGYPTVELVWQYFNNDSLTQQELAPYASSASQQASDVIATVLTTDDASEYMRNLRTALRAGHVEPKHMGLVVSAVAAYKRLTTPAKPKPEPTQYTTYGTPDDKISVTGTITTACPVESHYGYRTTYRMLLVIDVAMADGTHALIKTTTSASWAFDVNAQDTVTVAGKVKEHTVYNDRPQTVITYPKRLDQAA